MSEENDNKDKSTIPRRKALLSAGTVSAAIAMPGLAAADDSSVSDTERNNGQVRQWTSKKPSEGQEPDLTHDDVPWDEGEFTDENGEFSWEEVDFDEWEAEIKSDGPGTPDGRWLVGDRAETPKTSEIQPLSTASFTIVDFSVPSWVPEYSGTEVAITLDFVASWQEVGVNVTICFGGDCQSIYSFGVEREDSNVCLNIPTGAFPIDLEVCVDATWDGSTGVILDASADACVPSVDPCPVVTCQYCRSGTISEVELSL